MAWPDTLNVSSGSLGIRAFNLDWRKVPGTSSPVVEVSNHLRIAASAGVSHPVFLVELRLKEIAGGVTISRLSSGGPKRVTGSPLFEEDEVRFGVYSYQSVEVTGLTSQSVMLSLDNSTRAYAFFALSDTIPLKDQKVRVWYAYCQEEDIPNDYLMLVFDGYIDAVSTISEKEVKFNAVAQSAISGWTPRVHLIPPLCNHLPKAGTKIGDLVLEPGS